MIKLFRCVGNSTARRTTSLDGLVAPAGQGQPSAAGQDPGRGHAAMPRLGRFALRAVGERMASCVAARTRCLGFVGCEYLAQLSSLAHQSWTRRVRGAVPPCPRSHGLVPATKHGGVHGQASTAVCSSRLACVSGPRREKQGARAS